MKSTQSKEVCGKVVVLFAAVMILVGAGVVRGQSSNAIQVNAGESVTLAVQGVDKLAVADPAIADVVSLSDKEANIIGKKAGVTTLTIVHKDDKPTLVYRIEVGNDTMAATVRRIIDQPGITVKSVGDSIVLDGQVADELQAQRAVQVATAFKLQVVNLMEIKSPRQIRIRTRIVEVSKEFERSIGLKWLGDSGSVEYHMDALAGMDQVIGSIGHGGLASQVTLQLLEKKGGVRLLSEPTLITRSGTEASFLAGSEIPIIQTLQNVSSVEYKEVGVRMKIKPVADSQNRITTTIHAEVSQPTSQTVKGAGGAELPVIQTRKADTTLQLNDGQTIVIGGLLDNNIDVDTMRKFPWLADIPVIGALFRHKERTQNQHELLFFLTTEIIKDADAETAAAAQTPVMKDWNDKQSKQDLLKAPKKGDDWGLHNPGRMGLPERKSSPKPPKAPETSSAPTATEPASNFTPARPAGQE